MLRPAAELAWFARDGNAAGMSMLGAWGVLRMLIPALAVVGDVGVDARGSEHGTAPSRVQGISDVLRSEWCALDARCADDYLRAIG